MEGDGFGGMTVSHDPREDQAGEGHFLIGDGVADFIFGDSGSGKLREVKGLRFPGDFSLLRCTFKLSDVARFLRKSHVAPYAP